MLVHSVVLLMWCVASSRGWCQSPCECKLVQTKTTAVCANANLTAVPKSVDPDVEALDLSQNAIERLDANVFANADLSNLQYLSLRKNRIATVHADAFRGVLNLRELDLSENRIGSGLEPETIPRWVLKLSLGGNPLIRLDAAFLTSPLLRRLDLDSCQIEYIHPDAFQHLVGLRELSLRRNRLVHLNESVFTGLRQLESLHLEENPWNCDCRFRKFKDWYYKMDDGSVTCVQPNELNGKPWKGLTSFDFFCRG